MALVDLQNVRKEARKDLERKRYVVLEADAPPSGERWLMSINLTEADGRGVGSAATLFCLLKDQQSGLTQWQSGGSGAWQRSLSAQSMSPDEIQQFGLLQAATVQSMAQTTYILLATLLPGSARKDALNHALLNALQSIPALPKTK